MQKLIAEYQERLGWNDQTTIMILCDFIKSLNSDYLTSISQLFTEYLENRAQEEQIGCPSPGEEDDD